MGSEQQRDMEQAFERLFVKTHGKHTTVAKILIDTCVHTYPENDTSLCVGVHTHHVLSQIAGSPSLPAEEQIHSEHSEETAPSHETTGDTCTCSSPTEPSLSEEQPPVCTYITTLASLPGFLLLYKQDFDKFMKLLSTLPII